MWIWILKMSIVFGLICIWTEMAIGAIKKKGKKMEKIYWNESAGQIMTKGGQCLYDRKAKDAHFDDVMGEIYNRVAVIEKAIKRN